MQVAAGPDALNAAERGGLVEFARNPARDAGPVVTLAVAGDHPLERHAPLLLRRPRKSESAKRKRHPDDVALRGEPSL